MSAEFKTKLPFICAAYWGYPSCASHFCTSSSSHSTILCLSLFRVMDEPKKGGSSADSRATEHPISLHCQPSWRVSFRFFYVKRSWTLIAFSTDFSFHDGNMMAAMRRLWGGGKYIKFKCRTRQCHNYWESDSRPCWRGSERKVHFNKVSIRSRPYTIHLTQFLTRVSTRVNTVQNFPPFQFATSLHVLIDIGKYITGLTVVRWVRKKQDNETLRLTSTWVNISFWTLTLNCPASTSPRSPGGTFVLVVENCVNETKTHSLNISFWCKPLMRPRSEMADSSNIITPREITKLMPSIQSPHHSHGIKLGNNLIEGW